MQFADRACTGRLGAACIRVSMDGRGRALNNIFVERLWHSVKYEDLSLPEYANVLELDTGLDRYFTCYHTERLHQIWLYCTPTDFHFDSRLYSH